MALPSFVSAQNLVLNPGFEDHSACPSFINQLDLADHWLRPTPGTSDYFNRCASFAGVLVPGSGFGDQEPYDGDAYAGLVTYVDTNVYAGFANYREYLSGRLSEPLAAGKFYRAAFQVSVADLYRYGTSQLGMYFTDTVLPWSGSLSEYPALGELPYSLIPQMEYTASPVEDELGWTEVQQEFQADGGEKAFILGNFRGDAATERTDVYPWGTAMAYLFIDAVSVERVFIAPLALPDSGSTIGEDPVLIAVLDNDSDRDGVLDPSTLILTSAPLFGSANLEPATGEIRYTAFPGNDGTDSFYYRICDEEGLCDTTWVVVEVEKAIVQSLLAVDDAVSTPWSTPVNVPVTSNDVEGSAPLEPSSLVLLPGGFGGLASLSGLSGSITFLPDADFCGTALVTYQICDQNSSCDTAQVWIDVVCADVVCIDDAIDLQAGESADLAILFNDLPGNGNWNQSTLTWLSTPSLGTLQTVQFGELLYQAAESSGVDRFRYRICDEAGRCGEAWVTVRIAADPVIPTQPDLFIPNIITPNQDGFNDRWVIPGLEAFDRHELYIINRWDQQIHHTTRYAHDWDGGTAPDGTYFYLLSVFQGNSRWTYTGALTVLR